jgi:hypothetical protein
MNLCSSLSVIVNQSFDQGKAYREPNFQSQFQSQDSCFWSVSMMTSSDIKVMHHFLACKGYPRSNTGTSHCLPRTWNGPRIWSSPLPLAGPYIPYIQQQCYIGWAPRISVTDGTPVPYFVLATSPAFPSVVAEARNRVAKQVVGNMEAIEAAENPFCIEKPRSLSGS